MSKASHFADRIANFLKFNKAELVKLANQVQSPKMAIVSCSDSRFNPNILLEAKPGEIFNIANIAGLIPPYEDEKSGHHGTSAALQFAVESLKVKAVVVLGHGGCGGIQSLIHNNAASDKPSFVSLWMSIVEEARNEVLTKHSDLAPEDQARLCEEKAIIISINNLRAYPFIQANKDLPIYGWHFNPQIGLRVFDEASNSFIISQKKLLPQVGEQNG